MGLKGSFVQVKSAFALNAVSSVVISYGRPQLLEMSEELDAGVLFFAVIMQGPLGPEPQRPGTQMAYQSQTGVLMILRGAKVCITWVLGA